MYRELVQIPRRNLLYTCSALPLLSLLLLGIGMWFAGLDWTLPEVWRQRYVLVVCGCFFDKKAKCFKGCTIFFLVAARTIFCGHLCLLAVSVVMRHLDEEMEYAFVIIETTRWRVPEFWWLTKSSKFPPYYVYLGRDKRIRKLLLYAYTSDWRLFCFFSQILLFLFLFSSDAGARPNLPGERLKRKGGWPHLEKHLEKLARIYGTRISVSAPFVKWKTYDMYEQLGASSCARPELSFGAIQTWGLSIELIF